MLTDIHSILSCLLQATQYGFLKENVNHHWLFVGSIYFTADIDILAVTDWLELLCRQLNIRSRGMT